MNVIVMNVIVKDALNIILQYATSSYDPRGVSHWLACRLVCRGWSRLLNLETYSKFVRRSSFTTHRRYKYPNGMIYGIDGQYLSVADCFSAIFGQCHKIIKDYYYGLSENIPLSLRGKLAICKCSPLKGEEAIVAEIIYGSMDVDGNIDHKNKDIAIEPNRPIAVKYTYIQPGGVGLYIYADETGEITICDEISKVPDDVLGTCTDDITVGITSPKDIDALYEKIHDAEQMQWLVDAVKSGNRVKNRKYHQTSYLKNHGMILWPYVTKTESVYMYHGRIGYNYGPEKINDALPGILHHIPAADSYNIGVAFDTLLMAGQDYLIAGITWSGFWIDLMYRNDKENKTGEC